MSLEQSIEQLTSRVDQLSTIMVQLIGQLEAGRTAKVEPVEPKIEKCEDAPPTLDYVKDVAPRFSLLVAKDRTAAIALMREFKADAKKLEEAILGADGKHDQDRMVGALRKINAKLGG